MTKLIAQGAEAKVYETVLKGKTVIKKIRINKSYRHPSIDKKLRFGRTKREAKILQKLSNHGFTPQVIDITEDTLTLEKINGEKMRDQLDETNYKLYSPIIGKQIKTIHDFGIIHGDLTTSNMIVNGAQVYLIDFGLSYFSERAEDKAVDLHLLKQTLDSKHYSIAEKCFKLIIKAYYDPLVLNQLKKVEQRGRNKGS